MQELIQIREDEYYQIKNLVYNRFGINLGDQKRSLVIGRLHKVLRSCGFSTFSDYYQYILSDNTGSALNTLINRISTNHTYFNRENGHFIYFKDHVLPEVEQRIGGNAQSKVRIWSAGCSSGEEAYMLAMVMSDYFGYEKAKKQVAILATDISETALLKAKEGIYLASNVQRMDKMLTNRYFIKLDDERYQVKQSIRDMVLIRRLNLVREDFPFQNQFDTIFCRNVMIYFDAATRHNLVMKFHRYLKPQSHLFIGHSESLGRSNEFFKYIQPAVYSKMGN